MVTVRLYGGLGNQMFQVAAAIGYARRYNMDYCIPTRANDNWPNYRFEGVNYSAAEYRGFTQYKEPAANYEARPYVIGYQHIPKYPNVVLDGHFQSEKYFAHCKDEIKKIFNPEPKSVLKMVSIHVRRGDYLTMQGHLPVITNEYLEKAIRRYREMALDTFAVFGDDPKWNIDNINDKKYPGSKFVFLDHPEPHKAMLMASMMQHNIGSNSSFSWWIHYLNNCPKKTGVFPETWFGPAFGEVDTKDLYPQGCKKM